MHTKPTKNWVQTHTGKAVNLLNPKVAAIDIRDIAFGLAHLTRYNGHAGPYTVLHHSVIATEMAAAAGANVDVQAAILLHDAPEAYIGDIVSPLKSMLKATLAPIERELNNAINAAFMLREDEEVATAASIDHWVKRIDHVMLVAESDVFFPRKERPRDWGLEDVDDDGLLTWGHMRVLALQEAVEKHGWTTAHDIGWFMDHCRRLNIVDFDVVDWGPTAPMRRSYASNLSPWRWPHGS